MVLFEAGPAETGISKAAEEKRREKVLTERTERVEKTGHKMPLIIAGFQCLTQRTVKFIRWLRSFFWQNRPLDKLRLILKKRYATLRPFTGHRSLYNGAAMTPWLYVRRFLLPRMNGQFTITARNSRRPPSQPPDT